MRAERECLPLRAINQLEVGAVCARPLGRVMLSDVFPVNVSRSKWPGLLLAVGVTGLAVCLAGLPGVKSGWLAGLPGLKILGALGWALVLGVVWRSFRGVSAAFKPGVSYAARTVLRLGILLLGVRLNFQNILTGGPLILLLDALIVTVGIVAVERLGKALGLSRGLRLTLAFGTGVCGASAAVAAGGIVGADDEEVSLAVGTVSLLGTLGVLGYILSREPLGLSAEQYGLLTGSTLQEVGQVIAAGTAGGDRALDTATLTKLTRVALLAPALLVASSLLRMRAAQGGDAGTHREARQPLVPGFLLGFLILGGVNSLNVLPTWLVTLAQQLSVVLTAMAMAGIGLGVDVRAVARVGIRVLGLGAVGFGILVLLAIAVTTLTRGA